MTTVNPDFRVGAAVEVRYGGAWLAGTVTRRIGGLALVSLTTGAAVSVPVRCIETIQPAAYPMPWRPRR